MKEWILSIGAVIFVTVIIGYIIPDGKLGKFLKGVFSLLILFVIIKPIIGYDFTNLGFSSINQESVIQIQNDYIEFVYKKQTENNVINTENMLKGLGYENVKVEIEYKISDTYEYEIKEIKINLQNAVIKTDKEHIVIIEEIKKSVSDLFSIKDEIIFVNV